jgi:hypothetical protein
MSFGAVLGQTPTELGGQCMNATDGHSCLWSKARSLVLSFIKQKSSVYGDIMLCVRNTFLEVQAIPLPKSLQRNASAPARCVSDEIKEDEVCGQEISTPSSECTTQVETENNDADHASAMCVDEIPSAFVDIVAPVESRCPSKENEKGQHSVSEENGIYVFDWNVDLRCKNTTYRCGFQRKFSLNIGGCEVPFVFHIDPIAKELCNGDASNGNKGHGKKKQKTPSTFRRPGTKADMWIKCLDSSALPTGSWPMSVSISGGEVSHIVTDCHNFASECTCRAPFPLKLWDIPFEIPESGTWMVCAHLKSVMSTDQPSQNSTFESKVEEDTHSSTEDTSAMEDYRLSSKSLAEHTLDAFNCGIAPVVKHTFIHFPLSAPPLGRVFTTPASVP